MRKRTHARRMPQGEEMRGDKRNDARWVPQGQEEERILISSAAENSLGDILGDILVTHLTLTPRLSVHQLPPFLGRLPSQVLQKQRAHAVPL